MIKQVFNISRYWKVIVYYNIDYDLFDYIARDLGGRDSSTSPVEKIDALKSTMQLGRAKAFTYSIMSERVSIVGFNKHDSKRDYINSIVHEAEHVKQDVLRYYKVKDEGEPPAYTIGYIVVRMIAMLKYIL